MFDSHIWYKVIQYDILNLQRVSRINRAAQIASKLPYHISYLDLDYGRYLQMLSYNVKVDTLYVREADSNILQIYVNHFKSQNVVIDYLCIKPYTRVKCSNIFIVNRLSKSDVGVVVYLDAKWIYIHNISGIVIENINIPTNAKAYTSGYIRGGIGVNGKQVLVLPHILDVYNIMKAHILPSIH